MKTALQDFIERLNYARDFNTMIPGIIKVAESLLEKEKEQIVESYDKGYKACDLDEALEINKTMFSGEKYYEQTYNQ
jgi:hypothetical protein